MIEIIASELRNRAWINIDGDLKTIGAIAVISTVLQLFCLAFEYRRDRRRFRLKDEQVWMLLAPWIGLGALTLISYLFFFVALIWFILSKSGCP
jgi:4-amino-4-deoxy-L-arabinose transferase-like glycosyltransferase